MTFRDYELKRKYIFWYTNRLFSDKLCDYCEKHKYIEEFVWVKEKRCCCACLFSKITLETIDELLGIEWEIYYNGGEKNE